MENKDYFVIRNSDGADKWDKPIVVATNIEEYYIALPDKRLFDIPRVVLVEEEEAYMMVGAVVNLLDSLGVPPENILYDNFGA